MATTPTPRFNLSPRDEIFLKGKSQHHHRYHNIGQLQTPYIGKNANFMSALGDYGPPQRTDYYTAQNPVYPYAMASDMVVDQYLPFTGCAFGRPGLFPTYDNSIPFSGFIHPNYFSPKTHFQNGHVRTSASQPYYG